MSLLTATISGQFLRPDLGRAPLSATIEAVADGGRLTYAGQVIVGRFAVRIQSDGSASVTLPRIPQTGLLPSGARWRLTIAGGGAPAHSIEFTLTGDTTWDAIVDVSNVPLTSGLVADAQAARDQAVAAGAGYQKPDPQSFVAFGDSITDQGYSVTGANPYYAQRGWWPWANAFLGWRFEALHDSGVSGDRLDNMIARVTTDVLAYNPSWVWLEGGVNDVNNSDTFATITGRFQSLFTTFANAGIRVLCLTIGPKNTFTGAQDLVRTQVNNWLRDYGAANRNVIVADTAPYIQDPATATTWVSSYTSDGLHPLTPGAMAMGWAVYKALVNVTVPRSPLTAGADPSNILGVGGMFNGSTSGLASLWTKLDGGTAPTYSKATRTDAIQGEKQHIVVVSGTNSSAINLTTDPTTGFAVGDTIYGAVEVTVTGADMAAATGDLRTFLDLQCRDVSNTVLATATFGFDDQGAGAGRSQTFPQDFTATLRTPNIVVPATTTKLRLICWSKGGATRDWSRALIRKV